MITMSDTRRNPQEPTWATDEFAWLRGEFLVVSDNEIAFSVSELEEGNTLYSLDDDDMRDALVELEAIGCTILHISDIR